MSVASPDPQLIEQLKFCTVIDFAKAYYCLAVQGFLSTKII